MRKKIIKYIYLVGFIFASLGNIYSQELISKSILSHISIDSLIHHLSFLGSDALQGRATGTVGGTKAAKYIAAHLQKYQLIPLGDNNSYFQNIPMHGSIPLEESDLRLIDNDKEYSFKLKKDYLLYKSGAQTFIPRPVPLVFVGYGIIAHEFDYNDYLSIDVEGKIVVFLSGEPPSNDPTYFNGNLPTIYSYPEAKQRLAISRGARGSIMIQNPNDEDYKDWEYWTNVFSFEDVTLAYSVTGNLSIIMNHISAKKLFEDCNYTLDTIFEMEHQNLIHSFPLNTKISFKGKFKERDFFASNVIGMLEPDKNIDSYVIISAHYDHLGIGKAVDGDSIYNGVVDNAIGVSALLEMIRIFSTYAEQLSRPLIFLFTTGEEKGLLGSSYYIDHFAVPLYKTIANVNVDGLAIFDKFDDVIGIGSEYSSLGNLLEFVAAEQNLRVSQLPAKFLKTESFARSDQITFAKAGIPSLLIVEGLDYRMFRKEIALNKTINWFRNIYHSPFDDLNQPINFQAVQQHLEIITSFCYYLSHVPNPPEWYPGTPFINIRLQTIAEKK